MSRNDDGRQLPSWKSIVLIWGAAFAVLAVAFFFINPRRGASWTEDEGLFLYAAQNAALGHGPDLGMPQAAHYLLNAGLIWLGVDNILFLRNIFIMFQFASLALFLMALCPRRAIVFAAPIAAAIAAVMNLNSIFNHYTTSITLFLLGFAIYAASEQRPRDRGPDGSAIPAALLLAAASVASLPVGLGLLVSIGAVSWWVGRGSSFRRLALFYAGFLIVLLSIYGNWVGWHAFLVPPTGHSVSIGVALGKGLSIVFVVARYIAIAGLCAFVLHRYLRVPPARALDIILLVILANAAILFVSDILGHPLYWKRYGDALLILARDQQHPTRSLGAAAMAGHVICIAAVMIRCGANVGVTPAALRSVAGFVDAAGRSIQELRRLLASDTRLRLMCAASFSLLLMEGAGSVASNTSIYVGMMWYVGPFVGLTILHRRWLSPNSGARLPFLFGLTWLGLATAHGLLYNHADNSSLFAERDVITEPRVLAGVRETPQYIATLGRLMSASDALGCRDATMVTTDYMPFVLYVLQARAPSRLEATRPAFGFPAERIQKTLAASPHWCVLHGTGLETSTLPVAGPTATARRALVDWLTANSAALVDIPSPDPDRMSALRLFASKAPSPVSTGAGAGP